MNNIQILREQRGMTQEQFAEYCGISRISIARYESGAQIHRANAEKIAAACHVSVDYVIGIKADERPQESNIRTETALLLSRLSPAEMEQVLSYAQFVLSKRK